MIDFNTMVDLEQVKLNQQVAIFADNVSKLNIVVNNLLIYAQATAERLRDFRSTLKDKNEEIDVLSKNTALATKELLRLLDEAGVQGAYTINE